MDILNIIVEGKEYMKNKGFTLIELLAVIVILAVILAIAIPSISGIIKSSTKEAFHSDAKMVLTALGYEKLKDDNFNPLEITRDNMTPRLGLSVDNYEQINILALENDISVIIVGKNKWAGLTAYGTIKNVKVVNSNDYDVTPPSITIIGDNPVNVGKDTVYIDAGATAFDLKDGNVSITSTVIRNGSNITVATVDTSTFSTYTITYTAIDKQGNSTSSIRRVNIVDKTAPVITFLGNSPAAVIVDSVYIDAGATAIDNVDGDITGSVIKTGSVNTSSIGTYTITYNVSDSSGNAAIPVTRTVNVIAGTYTFNYIGSMSTWVAPIGVGKIKIEAWGAQGGGGVNPGGLGGYAVGETNITPGQSLYVFVGGSGVWGSGGTAGGFNGGGPSGINSGGGTSTGSGGGATDVRSGGTGIAYRIIVAGGGGGAALSKGNGGAGGGFSGTAGASSGGSPGTQMSGYSLGNGGPGGNNYDGGAGAGGGYYGGNGGNGTINGGGWGWPGGGGSSYISGLSNSSTIPAVNTGHGKVIITIIP